MASGGEISFARFEELRREAPGAPAILDVPGGRTLSRDDLARQIDDVATQWNARVPAGCIAMVQAPNGPDFVAAVLAAWREERVPLPVDRERPLEEVEALARSLGVQTVLRDASLAAPGVGVARSGLLSHRVDAVGTPPRLPERTAILKLTSGSTGQPRAVAVTRTALSAGIAQICSTMGIGPGDRNLTTLPLAHSYAFDNVLGTLILQGSPAVLVSDLVPRQLFAVVRETAVTVWPTVPSLLDILCRSNSTGETSLGSLRLVISAGAPLAVSTRESFAARFQLRPRTFYGATECGGIAFDREGTEDLPEGCVGQPLDGVSIEIDDAGEGFGRLRVRSASVAAATLPSMGDDLGEQILSTGDLGRIDEQGRVHLMGRIGQFVKIHGHKVHPIEIERFIRAIPGVRDVVVVPYARSRASEALRAVVAGGSDVDRDTVLRACERSLPSYKVPRSIEIRDVLPHDERGKIDRRRL